MRIINLACNCLFAACIVRGKSTDEHCPMQSACHLSFSLPCMHKDLSSLTICSHTFVGIHINLLMCSCTDLSMLQDLSHGRISPQHAEVVPRVLAGRLMYWASFVQETFKNEGLDFTMDGLTGNTLNSHRLIAYAGRQGYDVQDRLVEELFKAYFTEARPFFHSRRLHLLAYTGSCIMYLHRSTLAVSCLHLRQRGPCGKLGT